MTADMTEAERIITTIERLGHQGDGVAKGPLFARRTLPGEVVSGIADGQNLTDIRVETPSDARIKASCRHYKSCGGCNLQHASDAFVENWKQEFVRHALTAQGLEAEFRPLYTSPERSRRRATFAARRTKKGAQVGFYTAGSDIITPIVDCQVMVPDLVEALPFVEQLAVLGSSRKTPLAVTVTSSIGGLDVSVKQGKPLDAKLRMELAQLFGSYPVARLTWDDDLVAMEQPPSQSFGVAQVTIPAGAFLQATKDGELALLKSVQEITQGAKRIMDLFAGCGTFSLPLAKHAEVHAIEGEAEMVAALDTGWRRAQGLHKVTATTRDLFRRPVLPEEFNPFGAEFDAVVIDPPRAGAEAQTAELARSNVPIIAYVSCNPVSFARDARILVDAGYRLNWIQVVDQFRWSAHAELVASFTL